MNSNFQLKSFQQHQHRQSIPDGSIVTSGGGPQSRPLSATLSHSSADESLGGESSKSAPHNNRARGRNEAVFEQNSDVSTNGDIQKLNSDRFSLNGTDRTITDQQYISSNFNMNSEFSHDESSSPFEKVNYSSKKESSINVENTSLMEENANLKTVCSQLETQLKDLNNHYAQLYSAYQNSINDSSDGNVKHNSLEHLKEEINRHLQTMTVLIQEKSDLQTQLKHTSIVLSQKSDENDRLKQELKSFQTNTNSLDNLKSTNRLLEESFERQTDQLNRCRQEVAQLQAKLTETLQDKSEANARYKQRCKEFDALSIELVGVKQSLALKDMYLQQISAQTNQDHEQANVQNQNFAVLQLENQNLSQQILALQQSLQESQWQSEQSKERYEFFGRQLRTKLDELTDGNQKLTTENASLKSINDKMNEELKKLEILSSKVDKNCDNLNEANRIDENLKSKIEELEEKLRISAEEIQNLKVQLQEKVHFINESQENLDDKDRRLRQLEEYLDTVTTVDSNAKSLLEQLHNEKAATSRCMGQNLQLKRQLQELEEKFVSIRNEEMELATTVESLEHSLKISRNEIEQKDAELQKLTFKHREEIASLKSHVGESLRQDCRDERLEDTIRHYKQLYENCGQELQRSQNRVQILEAELEYHRKNHEKSPNGDVNDNQETMEKLNRELEETTQRLRRLSSENQELHRIMDQNAADENQNTIHVELGRAVDRCTFLSQENERLRNTVAALNDQLERVTSGTMVIPNNGRKSPEFRNDDQSSVCSEHFELKRDKDTMQNLKAVTEQLQQRLKRALDQNADLHDQNEQLEHLIIKLQNETDTIGEYVTLYQHQRKLIKDKLKEKEDYVAKLSHEYALTQSKLTELQNLMVDLLKSRQVLSAYDIKKVTKRPSPGPPTKIAPRPERLSETLVDETSSPGSPISRSPSVPFDDNGQITEELSREFTVLENPSSNENSSFSSKNDGQATVDKILKILTELQKPDLINKLPPCDRNLHCKYCRGHMIVL
uniref:Golgin subfamily A conserved domain-containing protein n=1 Tax=Romanomermis culicivorax TaxID=13658 RepID=A0A915IAQ3_ROMCU